MHAKIILLIVSGLILIFPLSLRAQNFDPDNSKYQDVDLSELPDDTNTNSSSTLDNQENETSETKLDSLEIAPERSPAEASPNDINFQSTADLQIVPEEFPQDMNKPSPSPTPPKNLTYLDYFYIVRAIYGGTIPPNIFTDYNEDNKVDQQDKNIVLQALNPNYDPATITPSPEVSNQQSQINLEKKTNNL